MLLALLACNVSLAAAAAEIDMQTARLVIDGKGCASIDFGPGADSWPASTQPIIQIIQGQKPTLPDAVTVEAGKLRAQFPGGITCEFGIKPGPGFVLFELLSANLPPDASRFRVFTLTLPSGSEAMDTLNAGQTAAHVVSLTAAEPNVHAFVEGQSINLETVSAHGLQPARFGVVADVKDKFLDTMAAFELAAGLPSPRPGGLWNKKSDWIKHSYLFITNFSEPQVEDVLRMAHRGGFGMILILQDSWTSSTGHYEINTKTFPGGLDSLKKAVDRFKQEGFKVGFHALSASIYPPDPYLTPKPDPRLYKDAFTQLASDIDAKADFIPLTAAPDAFPKEDGGYMGPGAVLQIDDELLWYQERAMEPPFGFKNVKRGYLDTTPAAHSKDAKVAHVKKSYGYVLYDMDTPILDEISSNFAKAANACDIDMIYFDGSEGLQGDHWYYNARMHKAFFDKLARKDILLQASSFSHYSWHILARSASADGHGDLKGYLDERSGWLDAFKRNAMPLDIGWYYGYDPTSTPDMFEYVLGATIGYNSSMSFQVSLDAASRHPYVGEVLDLIGRYERLRLSGRVPEDMRARLRIDPSLAGEKTAEQRDALLNVRREYRLLGPEGKETFQRVMYQPWHDVTADPKTAEWKVKVEQGPSAPGVQVRLVPGPWMAAGPAYNAADAVTLESFDDLAPYLAASGGKTGVTVVNQGEGGATLPGVTQTLAISDQEPKEGGKFAVYTAESSLGDATGWSVVTKVFDPPIDLSWHKAIGFWLRGDGNGGQFKLQLTDGKGAADFYIANNYSGWRYQQLMRPEKDPLDYSKVRTLSFYYNGLPAHAKVSCGIDGVKALRAADANYLKDPVIEFGGQRFAWQGTLNEGQSLFMWPGEPWRMYSPGKEVEKGPTNVEAAPLDNGEHAVKFSAAQPALSATQIRTTLQPNERYEIK
jgi:hypothetical protein